MFWIEPAELRCNHIGQARAEVVLLGVAAHIGEREDDKADFVLRRTLGREPAMHSIGEEPENRGSGQQFGNPFPWRRAGIDSIFSGSTRAFARNATTCSLGLGNSAPSAANPLLARSH